jgi:D-threo-aldose 1-dehydrogenase
MNPFERVPIGLTGVPVTRLGLGLAPLAGLFTPVGAEQAYATVERAFQLGIRYFDTAPLYGNGLSERRSGRVLSGKPRAEFTLSTKVGRLLRPGGGDGQEIWAEPVDEQPVFDFSAGGVRTSYAESLARLGLDRAEILHIHDPDDHYSEAVAEALPELVRLRAEGRIGAVSVGMNQTRVLADLVRTGELDCVLLAGRYSLLDQSALTELLPLCTERGVSVIVGGVFNSGLLADPKPGATYDYAPANADLLDRALALKAACERHGVPLRAAALQFPFTHPAVSTVLVGARSPEEVTDAVAMASVPLPQRLWRDLRADGLIGKEVPTR